MQEFSKLRQLAKAQRDKTIEQARKEYEAAIVKIAALEHDLLGRFPGSEKAISTSINTLVPRDRSFSTLDVLASLEAMDPTRNWKRRSVERHIFRMRESGLVRRVRKASGNDPAEYVCVGVELPEFPFQNMTLRESVAHVLTKPMSPVEIAVTLLEQGYVTKMARKDLHKAIRASLGRGKFKCKDGKWERA